MYNAPLYTTGEYIVHMYGDLCEFSFGYNIPGDAMNAGQTCII